MECESSGSKRLDFGRTVNRGHRPVGRARPETGDHVSHFPTTESVYFVGKEEVVMSAPSLGAIAKQSIGGSIALSLFMILSGILAIVLPPVAGIAVVLVLAWLLILSGAAHLVFAWYTRTAGALVWELLVGILYLFIGVYTVAHPVAGLASLTLLIAIYLFVEGVLEFVLSFRLRPMPGSNWLLFDGIVTLILAVMIWRSLPSSTEWVIGTLVGISMLFSGVARLSLSMSARRLHAKIA